MSELESSRVPSTESTRVLLGVRTEGRKFFISPTSERPDFFDLSVENGHGPREAQINEAMRTKHGVVVGVDRSLSLPEDANLLAFFFRLKSVKELELTESHGRFTPEEVIAAHDDLLEICNNDQTVFETEERRMRTIKLKLFEQVINLF